MEQIPLFLRIVAHIVECLQSQDIDHLVNKFALGQFCDFCDIFSFTCSTCLVGHESRNRATNLVSVVLHVHCRSKDDDHKPNWKADLKTENYFPPHINSKITSMVFGRAIASAILTKATIGRSMSSMEPTRVMQPSVPSSRQARMSWCLLRCLSSFSTKESDLFRPFPKDPWVLLLFKLSLPFMSTYMEEIMTLSKHVCESLWNLSHHQVVFVLFVESHRNRACSPPVVKKTLSKINSHQRKRTEVTKGDKRGTLTHYKNKR